ncbi:MAG: sugar ABC transporter substrate-binding protein [Lachnospiraceae bacterium]
MKKKVAAILGAVCMTTALLAGCGGQSTTSSSTSAGTETQSQDAALKVGMVVNDGGADTYQTTYYTAAQEYAAELGIDLQLLDPKGDVTVQANQVQDLIGMNCDVIVVWPVNSETAVASVKAVSDAGIPVMTANTNVVESGEEYIECYVGPSNYEEGKASAEVMAEDLGNSGSIVEITGQNGYSTTTERSTGMTDLIAETDIELLDSQPADGNREKAQQVMENYLVKYAKGELDAVFCFDDNTAFGAINAIEAAGRQDDIKVYAAAAGDYATVSYVEQGKLSGIAMQSPIIDSQTALDFAVRLGNGEEITEFYNYIETPVATPENISTLELEEW